jgi:gluconate kinase
MTPKDDTNSVWLERDYQVISQAVSDANRFIIHCNHWMRQYRDVHLDSFRSREHAQVLRSSLDLTYSLVALRKARNP